MKKVLYLEVPVELHAAIARRAAANGRTLTAEATLMLKAQLTQLHQVGVAS